MCGLGLPCPLHVHSLRALTLPWNITPALPGLSSFFWRRQWHPTLVLLPGKSHGWRSLEGCSPWGHWGSDTTERLHFHALEKEMATHSSVLAWRIPGTGRAWWAAVYGVAQSRTRLKRLSSSSSSFFSSLIKPCLFLWTECLFPSKFMCWNPNPQCDGIWRWDLWEVSRFTRSYQASLMGLMCL